MKQNADRLSIALAASHSLALRLDEPAYPLAALTCVQNWQRRRLAQTYADFVSQSRYSAAVEFFLQELYGGLNFRERDQQMEKVLPVMIRMLRDDMLLVVAQAFELQSLSLDFDMDMAELLRQRGWDALDTVRYAEIYRACGRVPERKQQIELICHLGQQLDRLVRHRLVLFLIKMLRGPAHAAGFGLLQTFLERGLNAFRAMGDGTEFIEAIGYRESLIMERLLAGEAAPFADV
ncbi:MAG: hypothetical protein PVF89_02510 [Lysobacterales bacterium]|jgi:hypothetical protein